MAAPLPLPALHATHAGIWLADGTGDAREASRGEAIARAAETPLVMLNAPLVGQRLGYPELSGLDLLELFAFVHPAAFAVPTPAGLARALGLEPPVGEEVEARFLGVAAAELLDTLGRPGWSAREGAHTEAQALHRQRWAWGAEVAKRVAAPQRTERMLFSRLPKWEDAAPRSHPRD